MASTLSARARETTGAVTEIEIALARCDERVAEIDRRRGQLAAEHGIELVDAERPEEIASAISRLLDDDEYAAECSARGLARARAFSWERTAHQVLDVYRDAVAHRARRARP